MTNPDQSLSLQPAAGWVLVPVEATPEMVQAGEAEFRQYCLVKRMLGAIPTWTAMLNAAPKAPATCIGKDPLCPCADGDVCHYVATKKTKAWVHPVASTGTPLPLEAASPQGSATASWVSVDERLPEPDADVLAAGQGWGTPFVMACRYDAERREWWQVGQHWTDAHGTGPEYPTHWMPYPPPPGEQA